MLPGAGMLADGLPRFVVDNAGLLLGALIVVAGLGVLGWRDLIRFSPTRIWAISSVCFTQSLRRRVLWLTPPVMLGVIVAAQLARPIDAQDDIRQTTKFLLFATGLLVTLVIILLAATNLPKEIENRVIYTVATKPTTRLEIVVGKVVGFARVSAALLLLMGAFSLAYLQFKDWRLRKQIDAQLQMPEGAERIRGQTLEYYRSAGLLHARAYEHPTPRGPDDISEGLAVYSGASLEPGWCLGSSEQEVLVPFDNFAPLIDVDSRAALGPQAFLLAVDLEVRPTSGAPAGGIPREGPGLEAVPLPQNPRITVNMMNSDRETIVTGAGQMRRAVRGPSGLKPDSAPASRGFEARGTPSVMAFVDQEALRRLDNAGERIFLQISMQTVGHEFRVRSARITLPGGASLVPTGAPVCRGRKGTYGQQVRGQKDGKGPVAVYQFHNARFTPADKGTVPFELRVGIERSGGEIEMERDDPTQVSLTFASAAQGQASHTVTITPENRRSAFFEVPASVLGGGDFTVAVRNLTTGHWIGLQVGPGASLRLVAASHSFGFNLLKSLLVMWLMAILVVVIAVFCSTFVSWPIAVVLTLVILLGHWGVRQVGLESGMERQILSDVFGRNLQPAQAHAITESIRVLNEGLRAFSTMLPDITQFASIDAVEAGRAIPVSTLLASLRIALGFGLPLVVLTYVILRFKEVAP